jgi:hypothetical protein
MWMLLLVSLQGATVATAAGQGWIVQSTDHFEIYYQPPQRSHVDALVRDVERAYARLSSRLDHQIAEKVPVILVAADRDIPRNTPDARVLVEASGAPPRDHLVTSVETLQRRADVALSHELAHQFVFEMLPRANDEAPWVSEGLPDHCTGVWDETDRAKLREAVARGGVPAVERLTNTVTERHWGHALFDFIAAEYGDGGIRRYLASLRGGDSGTSGTPDIARAAFGVSAADLNAGFARYVRTHFSDR